MRKRTKAVLLCGLLLATNPAFCGTLAHSSPADPLLDGGTTTDCAVRADYAAGRDVTGRPVAPADVGTAKVPVPDNMAVPLHGAQVNAATGAGNGAYVSLDGKALDKLVNPPPCR